MEKFENIKCNLCNSNKNEEIYSSMQYLDTLGEVEIKLSICLDCSFIYQNPQLTYDALMQHYNQNSSGNIHREYNQNDRATKLMIERENFLSEFISTSNIKTICDIGGGNGYFLSNLKMNSNIERILIEPSNAILQNNDSNITKIKQSIEDIAILKYKKIDMLMCISALEHFKNPSQIMEKFNELLNDEGYLFIEVPNSLKPYDTLGEFYIYEHLNHFTFQTLQSLVNKHNFYVVKMEESFVYRTIRVIVKKKKKEKTKYLVNFFTEYSNNKNKFLSRINSIFQFDEQNKISIYGAGDHTRFLLERFNILDKVEYFIDSDLRKSGQLFYGKKILSPIQIKENKIKNILISSHDFEEEIFTTIRNIDETINIITIYKEL